MLRATPNVIASAAGRLARNAAKHGSSRFDRDTGPVGASCSRARNCRILGDRERRTSRAARTSSTTGRHAGPHPHRHRFRSVARARREQAARSERHARRASSRCPRGASSNSKTRRIATRCLPPAIKARVSIEAGATLGWHKYVGDRGVAYGLDHFGTSAPAAAIAKEYGFTPEHIADVATGLCSASELTAKDRIMGNQLRELSAAGQSVWLDNIRRSMFA